MTRILCTHMAPTQPCPGAEHLPGQTHKTDLHLPTSTIGPWPKQIFLHLSYTKDSFGPTAIPLHPCACCTLPQAAAQHPHCYFAI